MEITINIPSLKKKSIEKIEKFGIERYVLYRLIQSLGAHISGIPKFVSNDSFEETIEKIREMHKERDYSDLTSLINDLEAYYLYLYNLADKLSEICKKEGYVICENCGEIEKIYEDENGYYMGCCGNTNQSEIIERLKMNKQ